MKKLTRRTLISLAALLPVIRVNAAVSGRFDVIPGRPGPWTSLWSEPASPGLRLRCPQRRTARNAFWCLRRDQ